MSFTDDLIEVYCTHLTTEKEVHCVHPNLYVVRDAHCRNEEKEVISFAVSRSADQGGSGRTPAREQHHQRQAGRKREELAECATAMRSFE